MRKRSTGVQENIRGIVEVVIGLGCVVGLSWWMPTVWRPSHLIFCAFFIVVFAMAVRYRMLVAYSASVLAACIYGGMLWLCPEMRVQPGGLVLALEPFLLLVSGLLTSDLSRWQRQRLQMLEQKYFSADEKLQRMQHRCQVLIKANEELKGQFASQSASVTTLSDKVTRLWKLAGVECYEAILDLVIDVIGAQTCALYLRQNSAFHLVAARPDGGYPRTQFLNPGDPLIGRVIAQRKVVTIRDSLAEERQLSSEVAVMAGPLLNLVGEVIGVVVIDHMPLSQFTPGAVHQFGTLLRMASSALQTVQASAQEQNQTRCRVPDLDTTQPVLPTASSSNAFMQ